jgi:enediyne biosynthesis protein E4
VTATGQPPRLLRNDQQLGHHWLRLKLIGTKSNRSAIGAVVEVQLPDRTLRRHVMATRSYLSQVELPLTIGLGPQDRAVSVTIHWPDGSRQTLGSLQVDREHVIQQPAESANATSPAGRSGVRQQASEIPQRFINS